MYSMDRREPGEYRCRAMGGLAPFPVGADCSGASPAEHGFAFVSAEPEQHPNHFAELADVVVEQGRQGVAVGATAAVVRGQGVIELPAYNPDVDQRLRPCQEW